MLQNSVLRKWKICGMEKNGLDSIAYAWKKPENKMHEKRTKACQHKSDHHGTIIIVREKIKKRTKEKSRKMIEKQEKS